MIDPLASSPILFGIAAVGGYAATKLISRLQPVIPLGAKVRIRMAGGVARSVLVAQRRDEWVFGALLTRFAGDLPEPGDSVLIETASHKGVHLFRVRVKSIDREPFGMAVEPPHAIHHLERRQDRRVPAKNREALLEGTPCEVDNLSRGGAKILAEAHPRPGDRLNLRIDGDEVGAWVLDSRGEGESRCVLRVCFDERIRV